jgi:hypothetical protein
MRAGIRSFIGEAILSGSAVVHRPFRAADPNPAHRRTPGRRRFPSRARVDVWQTGLAVGHGVSLGIRVAVRCPLQQRRSGGSTRGAVNRMSTRSRRWWWWALSLPSVYCVRWRRPELFKGVVCRVARLRPSSGAKWCQITGLGRAAACPSGDRPWNGHRDPSADSSHRQPSAHLRHRTSVQS